MFSTGPSRMEQKGKKMKRFVSLFLCFAVVFTLCGTALADNGRLEHFLLYNEWSDDVFGDVGPTDWFYDSVRSAYRMGLLSGTQEGVFSPGGNVTLGETVALAARIHSLYARAHTEFPDSDPWYQSYVDYALENHIIAGGYGDYNAPARRSEFASILVRALPPEFLPAINTVENNAIPDVPYSKAYAGAVYSLYRAGILTGSDENGSFLPETNISRAEAAAVAERITLESARKTVLLNAPEKQVLSGEEIFARCSEAVFYIEMLDENGKRAANGSGFFIDSDGTAVTCWHVIANGVSARVVLPGSDRVYSLEGVYDYNPLNDWAVVKIDGQGEEFAFLEIGDAKTNVGGASVYAFGSPLGIQNTITQGLICNPLRVEDGTNFILFSAAISTGSSGGALINKYGEAVGITAATYVYGQNLNLAINITYIDGASRTHAVPLPEVLAAERASSVPGEGAQTEQSAPEEQE